MPEIEEPYEKWWNVGDTVINAGCRYIVTDVREDMNGGIDLHVRKPNGEAMGYHDLRLFKSPEGEKYSGS